MEYKFSDALASLKPSAIREILKNSGTSIPLSAGNPAPDAFPVSDLTEIIKKIMEEEPILALQYGITEGYAPLRESLSVLAKDRYRAKSDNDSVIITSGAQQIMSLMSQAFINEGDTVICEEPSFIGALNCFRANGARLRGVPVQKDGMDTDELEKALKEEKRAKFIYTIPNFQNPAGVTMSLEKREKIYNLAKEYGVIVLEDNPYGDTRTAGEEIDPIKSFDKDGTVVYAGSFSKIIAPGIRVGFTVAPKEIAAKLTVAKQTQDVHTPLLSQLLVYHWLKDYSIEEHVSKIKAIYKRKLNLLCDKLDELMSPYIEYEKPEGGLFVWVKLNDNIDMLQYCKKCSEAGVSVVPGTAFLTDDTAPCQYIRLNFSTPTDEGIVRGVELMKEVALTF
ncbi:MAG: PLP-dependent aminotransferase family protein [Clostridiales bacterium]|nr:PLP-dependent aminotransferase family protein [Clostridiales bacterium]